MNKISNLEFFRKAAKTGQFPAQGSRFIYPLAIAKTLGFRLIDIGPGTATMELMADTEVHANPMGTIHSGVLHDLIIIGAGPGGIALAAEAFASGIDPSQILILEKGSTHNSAIRQLYPEKKLTTAN